MDLKNAEKTGIHSELSDPILMLVENQYAMDFALKGATNRRNELIDVRNHYICQFFEKRVLTRKYCSTDEILDKVLTMAFNRIKWETLTTCVGLRPTKSAYKLIRKGG